MHARSRKAGFTLIELSIVILIIGLIAGGILVGKEMIFAAQIRAQVTQIEQFRLAYTTFRLKYNGMPGDLRASEAASFGFTARAGTPGQGDGDNRLENCTEFAPGDSPVVNCELYLFWADLSSANLIPYTLTAAATDYLSVIIDAATWRLYMPPLKLRSNLFWVVTTNLTTNQPWIVPRQHNGTLSIGFTPMEAWLLDTKTDDGHPRTGRARTHVMGAAPDAILQGAYFGSQFFSATSCLLSDGVYNVTWVPSTADTRCQLNFQIN